MTVPIHVARKKLPAPISVGRQWAPSLKVIQGAKASPRLLVTLCVVACCAALAITLGVNIALASGAYQLSRLQGEAAKLAELEQIKGEELASKTAPEALCRSARQLGLQPAQSVKFLYLGDGAVIGSAPSLAEQAPSAMCVGGPRTTNGG